MRRRTVVAGAALIAAVALAGMPFPAGSQPPAANGNVAPAAFTRLAVPAASPALAAPSRSGVGLAMASTARTELPYVVAGDKPADPASAASSGRPAVDQPEPGMQSTWKEPDQILTGYASFYDNGTTAMRLPRGTVVRVCGDGGCILRTINDYGPAKGTGRIIDLYRHDFFQICGCGSWSGTTKVTVSVY